MRKGLYAGLAILGGVLVAAAWLFRPASDLPFDAAVWRASKGRAWLNESVRFRMRKGAIEAVKKCRNSEEVVNLIGWDGEADYARSDVPADPAHGFLYYLGDNRDPLMPWRVRDSMHMEVTFDRQDRVIDVTFEIEDSD